MSPTAPSSVYSPIEMMINDRVNELLFNDQEEKAKQIKNCGRLSRGKNGLRPFYCNRRECPRCAERIARRNMTKIINAVAVMEKPRLYIVSLETPNLGIFDGEIKEFGIYLTKLRRLSWFKHLFSSGIGALESKVSENGRTRVVHSHLVMDVMEDLHDELLADTWAKYTGGRGTFKPSDEPWLNPVFLCAFAKYATKEDTWCPPAANPESDDYVQICERNDALFTTFRRVHLVRGWGNAWINRNVNAERETSTAA